MLWTLYLSFAYLVYTIVLVLVVGWTNMGPWEWTGIAGGPVLCVLPVQLRPPQSLIASNVANSLPCSIIKLHSNVAVGRRIF